jgi:preprotein translocase subunit SecG
MLLNILLTIQIIVAALLGVTVLLQRSEGGALGMGGGPSGFMTARGQGDLLTRATWALFAIFLVLCASLTILAGRERAGSSVVSRGQIERLDPNALSRPPVPAPGDPTGPAAPAPQLRGLPAPASGAPGSTEEGALGGVAPTPPPTK